MKSIVPILVGFLGTYLNDSIQFSLMNTSFAFWLMEGRGDIPAAREDDTFSYIWHTAKN